MSFFAMAAYAATDYPSEITTYAANAFFRRVQVLADLDTCDDIWSETT